MGHAVTLEELNWLAEPLAVGDRCWAQLRYRAEAVPGGGARAMWQTR